MRDSNVGKVRVDGFYDLVIVVPELLKLEIKVVQPGDELHLRRVAFDDDELLGEDAFYDKPAAVMLQSCLDVYKRQAFTEGNAWHYTWSVFHDVEGLIDLMGGRKGFTLMLDSRCV